MQSINGEIMTYMTIEETDNIDMLVYMTQLTHTNTGNGKFTLK